MRALFFSATFSLLAFVPLDAEVLDLGEAVELKLVPIQGGTFLMGSPKGSVGAAFDESNKFRKDDAYQRTVTLSKGFLIGVTEITQRQYRRVIGQNPSVFQGDDRPVDNVSWDDAVKFCEVLSLKTGRTVRLPTEAEWEYACRAGSTTRYYFGEDLDHALLADHAWYDANANRTSHPVGLKKPNAWGLYDMPGNVWEWCADRYKGPFEDLTVTDPKGASTGVTRVLRGGSWETGPLSARSANRGAVIPSRATSRFGFRVVVELDIK